MNSTHPHAHPPPHPRATVTAREFTMRFTSTPRGARLARRLVAHRLDDWGHPYGSTTHETLVLLAAELTANAVRHGHLAGWDFGLRLTAGPTLLRIEVTDARTDRLPPLLAREPAPGSEHGWGLLLVQRTAARWGVTGYPHAPGKTVWAEVDREVGRQSSWQE